MPRADNAHRFRLVFIEQLKEQILIREVERIGGLLELILPKYVAVGHIVRPCDIINVLHALNIHRKALEPVGDLHRDGLHIVTADLLEIGELRDLHAVQPDLPAEPPRAERR